MSAPKTMAVKITDVTYPIAAACLPAGFVSNYPMSKALGKYIVINDVFAKEVKVKGRKQLELCIDNVWMDEERFNENFAFVEEELENQFAEVIRI